MDAVIVVANTAVTAAGAIIAVTLAVGWLRQHVAVRGTERSSMPDVPPRTAQAQAAAAARAARTPDAIMILGRFSVLSVSRDVLN